MSRLKITGHKGFHFDFNNNWCVSVQFGPGNYCEQRNEHYDSPKGQDSWSSSDAEIAVWKDFSGEMIMLEHDTVRGWTSAEEVAKVLHKVSTAKSTLTSKQMTKRLSTIWK